DFRLPLFFIVSGYLFSASKYFDNLGLLIRTKLLTLVLPYFTAGLLTYCLWTLIRLFDNGHSPDIAWYKPLLALLYGNYSNGLLLNIPIWFLTCLFVTQIIFCIVMRYIHTFSWQLQLGIMLALSLTGYGIGQAILLPWNTDVALVAQLFVFIGYKLKQHQVLGRIRIFNLNTLILLFIFLAAAYFNSYVDMNNRVYGNLLLFYLAGIAGSLLAFKGTQLLAKSRLFTALLTYIGQESLVILIFHYGVFILLLNFLERYVLHSYLGWFPTTVIAVAGSLALNLVIKKVPVIYFLISGKKTGVTDKGYRKEAVTG
ncbi:hypothetical protein KC345_g11115, partial [Hortaea werneckii]